MDDQYLGSVIVVKDNKVEENIPFMTREEANDIFLNKCKQYISNFDEYSMSDIGAILDNDRESFGHGEVSINLFN